MEHDGHRLAEMKHDGHRLARGRRALRRPAKSFHPGRPCLGLGAVGRADRGFPTDSYLASSSPAALIKASTATIFCPSP